MKCPAASFLVNPFVQIYGITSWTQRLFIAFCCTDMSHKLSQMEAAVKISLQSLLLPDQSLTL